MTAARITFHPERRGALSVTRTETHWGYILRRTPGGLGGAATLEAAVRGFGLLLVAAAYGQWLLPGWLFIAGATSAKISISAALAVTGAVMYFAALRGLVREVQVDTTGREFRVARRNGRGRVRVARRVPFEAAESVFVRCHEGGEADLLVRVRGGREPVWLMGGVEHDLNLLHARLCRDLQSPAERVEARLKAARPRKFAVRAPIARSA